MSNRRIDLGTVCYNREALLPVIHRGSHESPADYWRESVYIGIGQTKCRNTSSSPHLDE